MKPSRQDPTDQEAVCVFKNPADQTQAKVEIPAEWFQNRELQKIKDAIQQSLRDTPLFQHGANFTGRAVQPIPPVYSAEKVAGAILRLVRHPGREIVVGNAAKLGLIMHVIAPALTERIFAKRVEQKHFQDRLAPSTEGNLFKPMTEYHMVSGGWRIANRNRRLPIPVMLGGFVIGICMGLLVSSGKGPRRNRSQ